MVVSQRIALRWDPLYARCVGCGTRDPDRPHLAEGLCAGCFADGYGALGLDDVPPDWAGMEDTMTVATMERASSAAPFRCLGWWDKANAHHNCADPRPLMRAKGRCSSCYNAEHRARGGVRSGDESADLLARQGVAPLPAPVPLHPNRGGELPPAEPEPLPLPVVEEPAPALRPDGGYAWTLFDATVADPAEPRVTVGKDGELRLNRAAHAALGGPVAVRLYHDADRRAIALEACAADATGARKVRTASGGVEVNFRAWRKGATWLPAGVAVRGTARREGQLLVIAIPGTA